MRVRFLSRFGGDPAIATVRIAIKWLTNGLDLPLPDYQTPHSVGMDPYAAIAGPGNIGPRGLGTIPCGFAVAIPTG